jgi:hypothetical protein
MADSTARQVDPASPAESAQSLGPHLVQTPLSGTGPLKPTPLPEPHILC